METINSQLKMLSVEEDLSSPILMLELECGGSAHSKAENNGYGKLEFSIEETAVETDLRELRLALEDKNVDKLLRTQVMDNGTRSNVQNQSEVIRSF